MLRLVGAGFASVPAGGDQEQEKACPPTKGRLSRDLPNLMTRTLAKVEKRIPSSASLPCGPGQ
jgi:hypothetical protein